MKVSYSPYTLTPLKRANRLSSLDQKHGVLLKAQLKDYVLFADYFPHLPLGDRPREQFLDEFKFQDVEYDRKVFDLLLKDKDYQNLTPKTFFNHQLWTGSEVLEAQTIKYKLLHSKDLSFLLPLEKGIKVRLDGNGMFNLAGYDEFIKGIPKEYHQLIEYVEDPLLEKNWEGLSLKSARDFIESPSFDFYIYKPNCEFYPKTEAKIIFSAYLGGMLGQWHTYCELTKFGDLSLTHGILAFGFYEDERPIVQGNYREGFTAHKENIKGMYQGLSDLTWKTLCSM